ncbi:MAG: type 2 isopentenyl-diphosphate Delta-isomerase [Ignavibacteriales bacterium]|nr:type 2 isopentenyl-diphosphate Delta-isomerase [Ignavibacteriales bacterium]
MKRTRTSSRKQQHVEFVVQKDVVFRRKQTGFERWEFAHNALPEIDFSEVNPATKFLGVPVRLPILVSSMTGGYADALRINRQLAEVCAEKQLPMGVGSQRQALEDGRFHRSFAVVREVSKNIPVYGNIGAAEVAKLTDAAPIQRMVDLIEANGFAVHVNPLQELLQPEGNPEFRGVLKGIELLVKRLSIPVIVKEIGAGISAAAAKKLIDIGVRIIDVAGAGGTSWAGVEILRRKKSEHSALTSAFWNWGIPTATALQQVSELKKHQTNLKLIASGGITSGVDAAKALAMGADYVAIARPILRALELGGKKRLFRLLDQWEFELRGVMFLTGAATIADLQHQQLTRVE